MLLRTVAPDVRGPAIAASALRTPPTESVLSAARPPPASPDRRRKVRRSSPVLWADRPSATDPRDAELDCWRCVLLISTAASSTRITIDAIVRLHVIGLFVTRLALVIVVLAVRL